MYIHSWFSRLWYKSPGQIFNIKLVFILRDLLMDSEINKLELFEDIETCRKFVRWK